MKYKNRLGLGGKISEVNEFLIGILKTVEKDREMEERIKKKWIRQKVRNGIQKIVSLLVPWVRK